MNDILELLKNLAIFATIVTISTDNIEEVLKPYFSVTKYKLTIALILTSVGVASLNVGIFESIGIITNSALSWIHYVDICFSILILVAGAKSLHRLADMVAEIFSIKVIANKGE